MALSRNIQRAFLNSKHTQEIAESQGKSFLHNSLESSHNTWYAY